MRINARLDEAHSRRLEYLKNVTQGTVSEVIKQAIDLYYEKVKETHPNTAELLQASGFIGCGEVYPDFSETYKDTLREILEQKHGHR